MLDPLMDEIEKKLELNKFLTRTLQLVLSVSLFSLFVWYSSGFSILPQFFSAYFSTCLFSMLTHTLERKYMFLICNAILAFVAKTSLLSSSSPPPPPAFDIEFQDTKDEKQEYYEQVVQLAKEEEQQQQHDTLLLTERRENEACVDEEEGGTGIVEVEEVIQDDEMEDTAMATNDEIASTEELNRKIEEFIRKMKEEIRIEAQTKPIAESLVQA